ncbi:MAG: hypothetical protein IT292_12220 [Deltaproteobacteria bacterium]|nr:hypothetical protein [Deltaproteobacteria bacterium]
MPFWVEESFASGIGKSSDLGNDLARIFQRELIRSKEIPVVEIFFRDRWPGRRGDFNEGNYQALMLARNAGYDLVLLGRLLPITDPSVLITDTKVVDVLTGVTLWSGQTTHTSYRREQRELLGKTPFFKNRPEIFDFSERVTELAECTVHEGILNSEN